MKYEDLIHQIATQWVYSKVQCTQCC